MNAHREALLALADEAKPVAYCDPADLAEDTVSMCTASAAHLSINTRYTMPLYAGPQPANAPTAQQCYETWRDTPPDGDDNTPKWQAVASLFEQPAVSPKA